jgi:hypothetical protein
MFRALRKRMRVSPTTAIATLALVFAMTGGAYAAKKYLITSTKQISPSVLKSLQGKAGPAGANGAVGAQGPAGSAGPTGAKGGNGSNGSNGSNGESVVLGTAKVGKKAGECEQGGTTVSVAGKTEAVCNGKEGNEGKEGEPWTDGGTLPEGKVETGAWNYTPVAVKEEQYVAISFPIRLKSSIPTKHAHYINEAGEEVVEGTPTKGPHPDCPGTAEKPEALAENLCVYEGGNFIEATGKKPETLGYIYPPYVNKVKIEETTYENAAGTTGALIAFYETPIEAGKPQNIDGTWAVGGD